MAKAPAKGPIVFRIHNKDLRKRFDAYIEAECARTGYRVVGTTVAERAISLFLDSKEKQLKETSDG